MLCGSYFGMTLQEETTMQIQYKNENKQLITLQQTSMEDSYTKEFRINGLVKKIEQHLVKKQPIIEIYFTELIYYKDSNETDAEILGAYEGFDKLRLIKIRTRSTHGIFKVENQITYSKSNGVFSSNSNAKYLYDNRNNLIATEAFHLWLPPQDPWYRTISKSYYLDEETENGDFEQPHISIEFNKGYTAFERAMEYPYGNIDESDGQDDEILNAQQLDAFLTAQGISSNMRAWYVNTVFLPPI